MDEQTNTWGTYMYQMHYLPVSLTMIETSVYQYHTISDKFFIFNSHKSFIFNSHKSFIFNSHKSTIINTDPFTNTEICKLMAKSSSVTC